MDKLFFTIYKYIETQKLFSFCVFLGAVLGLSFAASNIAFEEDITKLIPQTERSTEVEKVLSQVNFADKIIVNLRKQESGTIDDLTDYATLFIDSISRSSKSYIDHIQGKIEDEDVLNTLDFVYNNLPLFLTSDDYKLIQNKLDKDSIETITTSNFKTLVAPSGFVAKETILKDPLGLSFIALKKLQELSFGDDFELYNGYIVDKGKNSILLFITPKYASNETDKNAQLASELYELKTQLNVRFQDQVYGEYFGGTLIAVANAKQIKRDIQLTIGIAITILLVILILFYRKLNIPFILFTPTAFGALLAMAVLSLIRSEISAISLGIGSVLLGVTLDYALHILTHIRSNNNIEHLYKHITKPVLMSSLTTALAFLCLLFLKSQALQDLGIFAATSVLGTSVFSLIFIPQVYKPNAQIKQKKTILDRVASYSLHKNKWAIIMVFLLLGMSLVTYNKVGFNNDLNTLNYMPDELKEAQESLDKLTHLSSKSVYLAAYGATEDEALLINDSIFKKLQALQKDEKIIAFSSIGSLIQSYDIQNEKIEAWNTFWTSKKKTAVQADLVESGHNIGFKPSTFKRFYELINSSFQPLSVSGFSALKTLTVKDYITSESELTTVATLVKVQDSNVKHLVDVFNDAYKTVIIDRKHMNETFLGNLKNDFNSLVLYSSLMVLFLLFLYYRSLSLTLVTAIPIAMTWFVTIGVMGLIEIQFNIFNIIISTFIFGLGIDYCIFITNGLLQEYKTGTRQLLTHKTSIILSVITTILGVGVLIFAKHPALHSISVVSIIGIGSALTIAFTLQPLLFSLFIGSRLKQPISFRLLIHSLISFSYYGLGGFLLSIVSVTLIPILPLSKKIKMGWFHKVLSKFMKSVLYTNPFVRKQILNPYNETFEKQAVIISNHTSFLDILAIGMLHPKIIFLVNDWVYNSPVFGKAVKMAGFYPVSNGIDNGLSHLQEKVNQGYSLMAFPEGTRATNNKIKRFHKGAFYLAEQFQLDIVPVLIHGNSEVNPKGSFVIKDGSITLKILKRISAESTEYGHTYKDKTKQISAYFKEEFQKLRQDIEDNHYFHSIVLENFRFKGNAVFKKVKLDLSKNARTYQAILNHLESRERILHLSEDNGQLDFLLALDQPDRKMFSYLSGVDDRVIFKNSYITNANYKISVIDNFSSMLEMRYDTIILNINGIAKNQLEKMIKRTDFFVLLKESRYLYGESIKEKGFYTVMENESLLILRK